MTQSQNLNEILTYRKIHEEEIFCSISKHSFLGYYHFSYPVSSIITQLDQNILDSDSSSKEDVLCFDTRSTYIIYTTPFVGQLV